VDITDICQGCYRDGRTIAQKGHKEGCPVLRVAQELKEAKARASLDPPEAGEEWFKQAKLVLPADYNARKALPLYDFMFGYFPLAWLEVVKVAVAGNNQHNPGERLHWARHKSTDQMNTAFRHLFDHGTGVTKDTDGCYHLAKVIWRLSAELQLLVEKDQK
jgi:dATP/dGTP diphosphohydrolase, N-terminal